MNIKTDKQIIIYKYEGKFGTEYSTPLSRKNSEGQFYYGYIPVRFKQDPPKESKTRIVIKDAFLTFYLKKDNTAAFYIMIMDYEDALINDVSVVSLKQDEIKTEDVFKEYSNEELDELPF